MYFAHGPISYLINQKIQKKNISKLSIHEQSIVMILSILFGILPDVDLAILTMTPIPPFTHHLLFTHSVLLYISLWILLNLVIWVLKKVLNKNGHKALNGNLMKVIQYSFLIGTISHLLSDILLSYSMTFSPLQTQVTILGGVLKANYFASYFFTPYFSVELLLTLIFLLYLFKKYIKDIKLVKYLLYISLLLSSLYLSLTIYMNLQTYNMAKHFEDGKEIQDIDYDGIQDTKDLDTDSDGINNIEDIDRGKLSLFVSDISRDKYLVSNSQSSFEYYFGALDSYRLISQGYFEQNQPIEPVLKSYAQKKYNISSYNMDIPYTTLLYEYMLDIGVSKDIDMGKDIGNIFFVIDSESTLLNMGVLVGENTFGIVLEGDRRLVTHSKDEIMGKYPNCTIISVDTL